MRIFWAVWVMVCVLASGCKTPVEQLAAADRETYQILAEKQLEVLGEARDAGIETGYSERDPAAVEAGEVVASRSDGEVMRLGLSDALRMAVAQSPRYQARKETMYLSALTLTGERYAFDTKWASTHEVEAEHDAGGDTVEATNQLSVSKLLASGGTIGATLTNDILAFAWGGGSRTASTTLSVNLSQPLLRGFGPEIVEEKLTQAERNVIYEVRTFARFQRTFAVDIATQFYRLLQQQDTVRNEYNNYQNLLKARDRAEALAVDRLPEFQVDQTRQDVLRSRNRYILAVERYQGDLDSFKILLGLPLSTQLSLEAEALKELIAKGLQPVPLSETDGMSRAIGHRLDLLNEVDRFDDAKRKIVLAKDDLDSELEFYANAALTTDPATEWAHFSGNDLTGAMGLRLKLPLDRLKERNAYRKSIIDFESRLRDLALAIDNARNDLRGALRTVERARKNCEIQEASVALAERRVESANLLMRAGRAETRDLLEAQDALLQARNSLTQSLVDYHLARLNFLRDVGALDLDDGELVVTLAGAEAVAPGAATGASGDETLPTPDEVF